MSVSLTTRGRVARVNKGAVLALCGRLYFDGGVPAPPVFVALTRTGIEHENAISATVDREGAIESVVVNETMLSADVVRSGGGL